jgi:hypothetical protein
MLSIIVDSIRGNVFNVQRACFIVARFLPLILAIFLKKIKSTCDIYLSCSSTGLCMKIKFNSAKTSNMHKAFLSLFPKVSFSVQ